MRPESIYVWAVMIMICSLIGFCIENVWLLFRYGYIDNRNMNLPFLLGYGIAVLLIYMLFGLPKGQNDLHYFLQIFFFVSVSELLLGHTVEKLCGIHYWDYSALPLSFTRYTNLLTSFAFSTLISEFMRNCFPIIYNLLLRQNTVILRLLGTTGILLLLWDFLFSFSYMRKHRSFYTRWRYAFNTEPHGIMRQGK